MAQYPAAFFTVRIHAFFAEFAFAAGSYAGYDHMVAFFEIAYRASDFFNNTNTFVA
jgi:hypothetical protein